MTTMMNPLKLTKKESTVIKLAWHSFVVLLLVLFVLTAPVIAAETSFEKPAFKSGKAIITFADSPLKTMTEIPFSISLIDADGQNISDAKLAIDMDMPAMPMPPNSPKAVWQNDAYRGVAVFTMAGAWQVTVKIERPGQGQEQVVFDIEQVMMK